MRSFVRLVLGVGVTAGMLLGCNAIIGLKAPPEQDASTSSGSSSGSGSGSSSGSTSGASMTGQGSGATSGMGEAGPPLGSACTLDTDCVSGHCADGVCCNNACAGTCEACNLTGSKGTCSPIPANTDPQMECVMLTADSGAPSVVDAGAPDSGEAGSPGEGGSSSEGGSAGEAGSAGDAGAASDASADAGDGGSTGPSVNFPDSGYMSSDMTCAGSCDGKGGNGGGGCKYPDSSKTCGTQFCNLPGQSAGFACNSAGSCSLGFTTCSKYSCTAAACGTTCSQQSDCLPGFYCDSASTTCKPTLGAGLNCNSTSQCTSGYCTTGAAAPAGLAAVCCSTACTIPGGNCVTTPGDCTCPTCTAAQGSCQVFYRDYDGDGYGDINGDVTAKNINDGTFTAYVGCSIAGPKAGYVADHTDCDDLDSRAHPTQSAYFGTPMAGISPASYDFDCNGSIAKSVPEYPGMACEFCSATPTCAASASTCSSAGEQATFGCGPRLTFYCPPCKPPLLCLCRPTFGGCYPNIDTGFQSTVACGATSTETTCGTCGVAGDQDGVGTGAVANSYTFGVQQLCH